jgi:hypothetical protein
MGTRKRDVYPTRYFTASTMVLQMEVARREEFKDGDKTVEKLVLYFHGQKSGLVVGPVVWDMIAAVVAEDGVCKFDSDDFTKWPNHWVELYRDKTPFQGRMVDCIRVRKPKMLPPKAKAKKAA